MIYLAPVLILLILLYLVYRMPFFRLPGLKRYFVPTVFLLKILAGIGLFLVYSNYYTYRNTSDAFRYYDDAQVMYSALGDAPSDYFKMLTGIGSEDPSLEKYYSKMNNWNLGRSYNFYNDNRAITRFLAFVMLFAFGSYHVHTVLMCFLALAGLTGIYRFFVSSGLRSSPWLFCCVFLAPSVMFWGSGVLKEGLLLFGLGIFLHAVAGILNKERMGMNLLLSVMGILILALIKIYVFIVLVPCLLAFAWCFKSKTKRLVTLHAIVFLGSVLLVEAIRLIPGVPDPVKIITEKQNDFYLLARGGTYLVRAETPDTLYVPLQGKNTVALHQVDSLYCSLPSGTKAFLWSNKRETREVIIGESDRFRVLLNLTYTGSRLESEMLEPTRISWLKALPMAFVNAVFRPFIWEASNVFMIAAAMENSLIILLVLLVFRYGKFRYGEKTNVLFFCLAFFIGLSLLIGLVTPVAGAIVRYKVPALPFLFAAIYCLLDEGKKAGAFLRKWN